MGIRETVCYRDILRRHGLDRVYPVDWLNRIDTDPLTINENGQTKRISKHEVVIKQLLKQAMTGNLSSAAHERAMLLQNGQVKQRIELVRRTIFDVVIVTGTIRISLQRHALRSELLGETGDQPDQGPIVLEERFQIARRGGEARLILSDGKGSHSEPIPSLIGALVQARTWAEWVISGKFVTLGELARKAGRSRQYATQILRLAALSPDLANAVLVGDHSPSLTVPELTARFPLSWEQQSLPS